MDTLDSFAQKYRRKSSALDNMPEEDQNDFDDGGGSTRKRPPRDSVEQRKKARSSMLQPEEAAGGNTTIPRASRLRSGVRTVDATPSPESIAKSKARESGAKRKRQHGFSEGPSTGSEHSIAEIIKHHPKQVRHAAKSWVESYEENENAALIELLNSLFEVCGVDYEMDDAPLNEIDVDDVVVKLVNRAEEGFLEDYFSSKQKDLRGFKENLSTFWDNLILECQSGPLFDGVLLDKCMDYVIAISCTPPRVFRQVTTTVGLQMVSSLVTVSKTLAQSRETAQRQLNAEKRKRKNGPGLDSLNKTLSETHEKITAAEEMMRKIFTGLFMHRYRDVDPEIRMACIRAIGSWIVSYPSLFLQDLYLKYIGWTLNDKNAAVRKASITALQKLYEIDDNVPSLSLFTERFCSRMVELADDIDISVAVSAIGLLKHLLRHQLLGDEDLAPLYDLLIDESPLVRHAVGDLVYDHLIAQKFSSSQTNESEGSEVQLRRLLQILREFSSEPILSDYVIDAVWQEMNAIKDWKSMISMLLDDSPKLELTDQDATHLIRVLCASSKKAIGGKIVPSTDSRKVTLSKSQKESLDNNKKEITVALMKTLPKLLRKYLADKAKVPYLAELIMSMNLEYYNLKHQEQAFNQILQLLKEAFFKHGEEDILKACVKAMSFCLTESQAELQDATQLTMKSMEDELVVKLQTAINQAGVGDDEYSLLVNLRRLYQLQLNKAVMRDDPFTDQAGLLENYNNVDDEVIQLSLLNMFLHVVWCLKSLGFDDPDEAGISSLKSKRDILIKQLDCFAASILQSYELGKPRVRLCCTICVILSDLWIFFSEIKLSTTKLQSLGFLPSLETLKTFGKLCEYRLMDADDDDEEEDVTNEHMDYLIQKDLVVSAAAKLVAHGIAGRDTLGPEIISHFVMHGKHVAETVEHMLMLLKKNGKDQELSNMYLEALKRAYERHLQEIQRNDDEWWTSRPFLACKELASKLSSSFSGTARDIQKANIMYVVKGGLEYAFLDAPKRIPFLEGGVLQFALKLPPSEAHEILMLVQMKANGIDTDEDPNNWRPYHTFVDCLTEKASKAPNVVDGEEASGARRPPRARKTRDVQGKRLFEGHDSENEHGRREDEDDDTPLYNVRREIRANRAGISKANMTSSSKDVEDGDGPFSGIPVYNKSFFGSATEELLPAPSSALL